MLMTDAEDIDIVVNCLHEKECNRVFVASDGFPVTW